MSRGDAAAHKLGIPSWQGVALTQRRSTLLDRKVTIVLMRGDALTGRVIGLEGDHLEVWGKTYHLHNEAVHIVPTHAIVRITLGPKDEEAPLSEL